MVARPITTLAVVPEENPDATPGGVEPPVMSSGWAPPRWVFPAIIVFWLVSIGADVLVTTWGRINGLFLLIVLSLFFALAIEPGVNRLVGRGWRRGRATLTILLGVLIAIGAFLGAMGSLIGTQIADLLSNSERYISDTVDTINNWFGTSIDPQQVLDDFNDPNGAVQQFIDSQQGDALRLTGRLLDGLLAAFTIVLFTYYLVADGPRLRRSICSRLRVDLQKRVLATWELAIDKTGGYLYSRLLLAVISAFVHGIVFTAADVRSPVALALWVGIISQFLPVIGTYIAAVLPVLITFLDSPIRALVVFGIIIVYQQLENYVISPRITAKAMDLHPALAFGAALAGLALIGPSGALLALPVAAMVQAIGSASGRRHDVIDSELTLVAEPLPRARRWRRGT
jgi:predicted PurR-regulated permease PerM